MKGGIFYVMENIDEVKQINFLTTSTTKWHRYYRVTITFFNIHQKRHLGTIGTWKKQGGTQSWHQGRGQFVMRCWYESSNDTKVNAFHRMRRYLAVQQKLCNLNSQASILSLVKFHENGPKTTYLWLWNWYYFPLSHKTPQKVR